MDDKTSFRFSELLALVKQADHALWTVVDMLDEYQVAYPESEYLASLWSACAELEKSRNAPARELVDERAEYFAEKEPA